MSESLHVVCPACATTNRVPAERLRDRPTCGHCKARLFEGRPADLTRASFDVMIAANDIPIVVDFWASWCGPCKMMAPHFSAAAAQMEPRVRFAKVDTDAEPEISSRFNIRSIPTLILFKQGVETARQAGALSSADLVAWISTGL